MDSDEPADTTGLQDLPTSRQTVTIASNTTIKQLEDLIHSWLKLDQSHKLQLLMDKKILQQHITIMSVMQAYNLDEDELVICYRTHPRLAYSMQ